MATTLEPRCNAVSGVHCPVHVITDPAFYQNALADLLGLVLAPCTIWVLSVLPPSALPIPVTGLI